MLWTFKDALKHKKGLDVPQQKKWAKIANYTLKTCMSDKGKDCEGMAIKVANEQCVKTKRIM